MRMRACWKVAGRAVCCVSSGCPYGRPSSGSALPAVAAAAGSAPVGSGSAEHPPVRGQENSKSGSRSSVEDSLSGSRGKKEFLLRGRNLMQEQAHIICIYTVCRQTD